MGILLILQTIFIVIFINLISKSSWFIIITFIIIIGGLLILFTYIRRIASNEKFKVKLNLTVILIILILWWDEKLIDNFINDDIKIITINESRISLAKIYNSKSILITIILVIYLLLTIISVSKIVKHYKGPLRSYKKYEQTYTKNKSNI